jgi:nucleoside-diphosphate-sugar epimerase
MRIAILGATGFIGYDFTRLLLEQGEHEVTVIATSATNLTNISRHEVPVLLRGYQDLKTGGLGSQFDTIVNFAHPFKARGGMTQAQQIDILSQALIDALTTSADTRLIHISTMSVYEPFAPGRYFAESDAPKPPASDIYATSKAQFDALLLKETGLADRIMLPRPTIVYGPYCRPWTDGLMSAFMAGDVLYHSLAGRMQPLYVRDLSRFLSHALTDGFRAGPINLSGDQEMPWSEFFEFFQGIVGKGELHHCDGPLPKAAQRTPLNDVKTIIDTLIAEPAFTRLAKPISRLIPKRTRVRVEAQARANLDGGTGGLRVNLGFVKPFFAEDRLVNRDLCRSSYPDFAFTPLLETQDVLTSYMRFRFSDTPLSNWRT